MAECQSSIVDLLFKNFKEKQLNSIRFQVFPDVVDTLPNVKKKNAPCHLKSFVTLVCELCGIAKNSDKNITS